MNTSALRFPSRDKLGSLVSCSMTTIRLPDSYLRISNQSPGHFTKLWCIGGAMVTTEKSRDRSTSVHLPTPPVNSSKQED
ncbi:hypothetical protein ACTXT7_011422 [Hymenolepis weldensis]